MGPITLFDKSFLQSLSVDESVWFDHFFITNVCPLFYVETLADLDKSVRKVRTPEQEVEIIANKFPEMGGMPNSHHVDLCISNLLGRPVPMTGQIPLAGGRLVKTSGKGGAVFEQSSEAEAFSRWQRGEFLVVERRFARAWRSALSPLDLGEVAKELRALGLDASSCKNLAEAKTLAESMISLRDKTSARIKPALVSLNVPKELRDLIMRRWSTVNYPPLVDFAPYAAYVLTVKLFYKIALVAKLISNERPSNHIDIAYLYYLPFCMMFVSSDRFHERCTTPFLRSDQQFVWGQDLKSGLSELNAHFLELPDTTKEKGVYSIESDPPEIGSGIVARLWDAFLPKWREKQEADVKDASARDSELLEEIHRMAGAPALSPDAVDFDPVNTSQVLIKRNVRRTKGSWYLVAKAIHENP